MNRPLRVSEQPSEAGQTYCAWLAMMSRARMVVVDIDLAKARHRYRVLASAQHALKQVARDDIPNFHLWDPEEVAALAEALIARERGLEFVIAKERGVS